MTAALASPIDTVRYPVGDFAIDADVTVDKRRR